LDFQPSTLFPRCLPRTLCTLLSSRFNSHIFVILSSACHRRYSDCRCLFAPRGRIASSHHLFCFNLVWYNLNDSLVRIISSLSRLVAHPFILHETALLVAESGEAIQKLHPSVIGRYNRLDTNSHDHSVPFLTIFVNAPANKNCAIQETIPSLCLVKMATAQEQYVCKSCREIDFRPLLWPLKPGSCYPEVEFCSTYDKDCAVCVLLYEPLPSGSLDLVYGHTRSPTVITLTGLSPVLRKVL
jgi:hypothetical protein